MKTSFDCQFKDLWYNYDDPLGKKKKASNTLKKLHGSVQEVRRDAELFRNKVAYSDRFNTSICEAFALFLMQVRKATKELLKKLDLRMDNGVNASLAIVDGMLQALETELSHIVPNFNPID